MSQLINTDNLNTTVLNDNEVFKTYTHKLNDYNEMYNANNQLLGINNQEFNKINSFNNDVNNKLHILKQDYLLKEAGIHLYEMRNNIILFTIVIVSLLFYIIAFYVDGKLNNKTLIYIMSGIMMIYLIIIWIIIKFISWRKKNAWNQYYF